MTFPHTMFGAALVGGALAGMLLLLGTTVQEVLSRRDAKRFPPPGQLVSFGGHRLHVQCAGTCQPTVLLEMGAGAWGLFWTEISRELAKVARTCTYDRAGLGWSDPATLPRSPEALLADLRGLVRHAGEGGPVVLVGHSLGGLLIRLYQARYPEDVLGIALVESAHPRQWTELPPEIWQLTRSSAIRLSYLSVAGRFGFLRFMAGHLATQDLPEEVMPAYRVTAARPSAVSALASEILLSESLAAEVEKLGTLGDLPLMVVSAGRSFDAFRGVAPDWPFEEANDAWMKLQTELVGLSSRAWHRVSPESTHNIHSDDPELVVSALAELVAAVRARSGGHT